MGAHGDQDKELRAAQAEAQQTLTLKPLSPHTQAISLSSTPPWPGSPGPGLQWPQEPPISECSQTSGTGSWAAAPEKPVTNQPDKEAQLPKIQTLDDEAHIVLSGLMSGALVDVAKAQAVVSKVNHELKQLLARQGEVPPAVSALQELLPVRCPSHRVPSGGNSQSSQGKLIRTLSKDMARELRSHRVEEGTATERRRISTSRPDRRTSRKSAGQLTA